MRILMVCIGLLFVFFLLAIPFVSRTTSSNIGSRISEETIMGRLVSVKFEEYSFCGSFTFQIIPSGDSASSQVLWYSFHGVGRKTVDEFKQFLGESVTINIVHNRSLITTCSQTHLNIYSKGFSFKPTKKQTDKDL